MGGAVREVACKHSMRYPRVLNVVQNNRDHIPSPCLPAELRTQLLSLYQKLLLCAVGEEDALEGKLKEWHRLAENAAEVADVVFAIKELESLLSQMADAIHSGEAFATNLDLDEWHTEGHEYLGKRLQREFRGSDGRSSRHVFAKVVGWLPADISDYKDSHGTPAALWHILWDDGDQEDLEGFEEGFSLLRRNGESPDVDDSHGIWVSSCERDRWLALVDGARTTGAASLAMYLMGDRALAAVSEMMKLARIGEEEWDEYCFVCGDGGNLICCDTCPHTVHTACVGLAKVGVPKGDFNCFYCERDLQNRKDRGEDKKAKVGDKSKAAPKIEEVAVREASTRGGAGGKAEKDKGDKSDKKGGRSRAKGGPSEKNTRPKSRDDLEALRQKICKWGAVNESIAEVQPSQAALKKERWFVRILDGHVRDKSSAPKIASVQFFRPWRLGNRMFLSDEEPTQLDVRAIIGIGGIKEMLKEGPRVGIGGIKEMLKEVVPRDPTKGYLPLTEL
ncbi:hypothetical protein T484DRAFT_1763619 [Baffinella frigidus]|nr:hypothetical protein T484DRAFT_1763619 [Cryptophyta sp. CCMP2293]